MKEYIKRVVKSTLKQELVEGVDTAKYQKYIRHLRKVIPKILNSKVLLLATETVQKYFEYVYVQVYLHVIM